jgi:transcriptional regulator with XRE-family HTH domain
MGELDLALASLLKSKREELGLSQREAARRIGISNTYLYILEGQKHPRSGKPSRPNPDVLLKISKAYGIAYAQLMGMAGYLGDLSSKAIEALFDPRNKPTLELFGDDPQRLNELAAIMRKYAGRD